MFIINNYYYLYIENTRSLNFNLIRKNKKICIIYRNNDEQESLDKLNNLRKQCNKKGFKLYIANNLQLAVNCKANGLYLSSYNKRKYLQKKINFIGSAHNFKEIYEKQKQGCKTILLSRLFKTNYKNKKDYLGVVKFNLLIKKYNSNILPLGGINSSNLLKLNLISSNGFAFLSELKKKPVISNWLF